MVSDSGLQDLFEGIVDSSPHPAVDVDALHSKPDLLLGEVLVLHEKKKANNKVKAKADMQNSKMQETNSSETDSLIIEVQS